MTAAGIVVEVSRGIGEEEGGTADLQKDDEMTTIEMITGGTIEELVIVVRGVTVTGVVVEVTRGKEEEGARVGLPRGDEMKETTTREMTVGGESGGRGNILTN